MFLTFLCAQPYSINSTPNPNYVYNTAVYNALLLPDNFTPRFAFESEENEREEEEEEEEKMNFALHGNWKSYRIV